VAYKILCPLHEWNTELHRAIFSAKLEAQQIYIAVMFVHFKGIEFSTSGFTIHKKCCNRQNVETCRTVTGMWVPNIILYIYHITMEISVHLPQSTNGV